MYILVYIPCVVLVTVNYIHGDSSQQNTLRLTPSIYRSRGTLGTATLRDNIDQTSNFKNRRGRHFGWMTIVRAPSPPLPPMVSTLLT